MLNSSDEDNNYLRTAYTMLREDKFIAEIVFYSLSFSTLLIQQSVIGSCNNVLGNLLLFCFASLPQIFSVERLQERLSIFAVHSSTVKSS